MPNTREKEKLIELLGDIYCGDLGIDGCINCKYGCETKCMARAFADHLIANGVTVQEWISASEPPKDTYEYWIAYKAGGDYYYSTGYFDGKCWCSALTHHKIPVTHWMPLPDPPKDGD